MNTDTVQQRKASEWGLRCMCRMGESPKPHAALAWIDTKDNNKLNQDAVLQGTKNEKISANRTPIHCMILGLAAVGLP